MRWFVRIESEFENVGQCCGPEVLCIERPELTEAAGLGLTLEDGKRIMAALQERVAADQMRAFNASARRCMVCGRARAVRDRRTRVVDSVFRRLRLDAPRCEPCRCAAQPCCASPVSDLLRGRALPELLLLQARLGAEMPYRQAAAVLGTFLPGTPCFNHATTQKRLARVGRAIEDDLRGEIDSQRPPDAPAETMTVGIDGCFIKGMADRRKTSLEVVLGRVETPARTSEAFAFVRRLDGLAKARVGAVMRRCGRGPDTAVTVLSDGEDGMRSMLGRWLDPAVEHRLDWWHLYRRLEKMRESLLYLPRAPGDDFRQRLRADTAAVEHIRWTLWNGCECVHAADVAIAEFRIDLDDHLRTARAAGRDVARIEAMHRQLDEFRGYMYGNADSLVNYNLARLSGERVSTAHVESTVNQLVNRRMCKKQQMRWSPLGAQMLLHVRTAILNGRLHRYVSAAAGIGAAANDDGAMDLAA